MTGHQNEATILDDQEAFPDVLVQAMNAATNGIIVTRSEEDHPIVYCNPAFEQLTGYQVSEILGRDCRLLQGEATDPATRSRLQQAVQE
ncbi:hypothetical protein GCM10008955_42410 [Deinococcus malanensis]|uniref:PAS domain-containing protein n=1 Tax=Deinococcus malanensis TaxID=1706855 RepID=A0ABQ2F3C4_9DEIO|nr:PAS domain-containing protein [Deinococcus malanensis]GGK44145.1 hypothetical protein GCM10008955_42410 [Deinococcus malanensis]